MLKQPDSALSSERRSRQCQACYRPLRASKWSTNTRLSYTRKLPIRCWSFHSQEAPTCCPPHTSKKSEKMVSMRTQSAQDLTYSANGYAANMSPCRRTPTTGARRPASSMFDFVESKKTEQEWRPCKQEKFILQPTFRSRSSRGSRLPQGFSPSRSAVHEYTSSSLTAEATTLRFTTSS